MCHLLRTKNLARVVLHYTMIENEFLVVVYGINKFRHYITRYTVYLHTNHSSITYLMNKSSLDSRVIRWILVLHEFDIIILDNLGKHNVVEFFLSRLTHDVDRYLVDDAFLNEHLLSISIQISCFSNIEYYLAT